MKVKKLISELISHCGNYFVGKNTCVTHEVIKKLKKINPYKIKERKEKLKIRYRNKLEKIKKELKKTQSKKYKIKKIKFKIIYRNEMRYFEDEIDLSKTESEQIRNEIISEMNSYIEYKKYSQRELLPRYQSKEGGSCYRSIMDQ